MKLGLFRFFRWCHRFKWSWHAQSGWSAAIQHYLVPVFPTLEHSRTEPAVAYLATYPKWDVSVGKDRQEFPELPQATQHLAEVVLSQIHWSTAHHLETKSSTPNILSSTLTSVTVLPSMGRASPLHLRQTEPMWLSLCCATIYWQNIWWFMCLPPSGPFL